MRRLRTLTSSSLMILAVIAALLFLAAKLDPELPPPSTPAEATGAKPL